MPSADAIAVIKNDHRTVDALFKRFEQAGQRAHKTKRSVVDKILVELAIHATIEEQVLYPRLRERVEPMEDDTLEALEEHHVVKLLCRELETLPATHERFTAKVTVLIESVRHHVKEEESTLLPAVRKAFSRSELEEMGTELLAAKKTAPTRAHPSAPDTPPGNILAGAVVKPMDAMVRGGMQMMGAAVEATGKAARQGRKAAERS